MWLWNLKFRLKYGDYELSVDIQQLFQSAESNTNYTEVMLKL